MKRAGSDWEYRPGQLWQLWQLWQSGQPGAKAKIVCCGFIATTGRRSWPVLSAGPIRLWHVCEMQQASQPASSAQPAGACRLGLWPRARGAFCRTRQDEKRRRRDEVAVVEEHEQACAGMSMEDEGGSWTKWVRPKPDRSSIFVSGHQPRCRDGTIEVGIGCARECVCKCASVQEVSLEWQAHPPGATQRQPPSSRCGRPRSAGLVLPWAKDRAGAGRLGK